VLRSSSRLNRLFVVRVLGVHLVVLMGPTLAVVLRLLSSDQFAVPTIRLPVAPQQVAAVTLTLCVGWMLLDEWPAIVRTSAGRVAAMAGLRWGAAHVVAVGAAGIAVAGVPHYDAVPMASLMCSLRWSAWWPSRPGGFRLCFSATSCCASMAWSTPTIPSPTT
jgi:hypothetical protein